MRAQFHAAVSALFVAFVIILIAVIGVQFVAIRASSSPASYNVFAAPVWLLQIALTLVALGCLAGMIGWLVAFATHRSGAHRLAAVQTWIVRR